MESNDLFHVYHIVYPPEGPSAAYQRRLRQCVIDLIATLPPQHEVLSFVRPQSLHSEKWAAICKEHAVSWDWQTGYSYRIGEPARPSAAPPPKFLGQLSKAFPEQMADIERFMREATGPRPELTHQLSSLKGFEDLFPERKQVSAMDAFLGLGCFAMFCVQDARAFHREAKAVTGQASTDSTSGLDFVIPLFSLQALERASRTTLAQWFSLFDLYVAEAGPGQGLLIASRVDLSHIVNDGNFLKVEQSA